VSDLPNGNGRSPTDVGEITMPATPAPVQEFTAQPARKLPDMLLALARNDTTAAVLLDHYLQGHFPTLEAALVCLTIALAEGKARLEHALIAERMNSTPTFVLPGSMQIQPVSVPPAPTAEPEIVELPPSQG